jgi:tRNA(adenine34) deaminase
MVNTISHTDHLKYMKKALKQAQRAFQKDEVPIGAVIVDPEGTIISRAYNQVEGKCQQLAHAEIQAIAKACKKRGNWRLEGHWLYVTLEPCSMCLNLVLLSRLEGVVFGAESPVFGYHLDNNGPLQLYRRDTLQIIKGVGQQESAALLKRFFTEKRKENV